MNQSGQTHPEVTMKGNAWLIVALGFLWLLVGWWVVPSMYANRHYYLLAISPMGSAFYLLNTPGVLQRWHRSHGFRYYFPTQLLCQIIILYAAASAGRPRGPWLLLMPLIFQAVV